MSNIISSQNQEPASPMDVKFKRRTIREELHAEDFLKQIFPDEKKKFYYCHVNMDWLEIRQTPPDLFSMAYEGGLNLIGIGVAMNMYTEMLNSGQQTYFLPHYYFTFNSPDKYKNNQKITFDALSSLIALIAEDLYLAGYYISIAGGGISVYVPMILDWLMEVSKAEVQSLDILNKLNKSKEFYFVEFALRDPTYGSLMFNNLTYSSVANPYSNISEDPAKWMGTNQNMFNPQRFERQMKPYITKIYPGDADVANIRKENQISVFNTAQDTLQVAQYKRQPGEMADSLIDWTVTGVNFTFNISENREVSNLILKYVNKPENELDKDATAVYWVIKGDDAIEQFFRACSQFVWHPVITNYLQNTYMVDTGQQVRMVKQLQPHPIKSQESQSQFTSYQIGNYKFGDPLSSGVPNFLKDSLTNVSEGTGASGSTIPC